MTRRPTIEDVASRAGVSKGAVSFALNGRPGVAPATRERILAAADRDRLEAEPPRPGPAARRAFAVGLGDHPAPRGARCRPVLPSFIAGVETVLTPRPGPGPADGRDREHESEGYRPFAADGRVDGVFLTDLRVADPRPVLLLELGLPAVLIARLHRPRPSPASAVDDRPGHPRPWSSTCSVSVTAGSPTSAGLGRSSMGSRVARRGPAPWPRPASTRRRCDGPTSPPPAGSRPPAELLDLAEPPTAIVYANDLMAIAGTATAARPRPAPCRTDLSVAGFDDTEVAAYLHPALTTVRTDPFAGASGGHPLIALVDGNAPEVPGPLHRPTRRPWLDRCTPEPPPDGLPARNGVIDERTPRQQRLRSWRSRSPCGG